MIGMFLTVAVLAVLVVVHEFGHFLVAKMCGVGVKVFSLGFGKKLFSRKIGETEYAISAIPLGGYVSLQGEEDVGKPRAEITDKKSFAGKRIWQRALILLAGPSANLIFAAFLFAAAYWLMGVPEFSARIGSVAEGSPAAQAGIKAGDVVVSVNGAAVRKWQDVSRAVINSGSKEMSFVLRRKGTSEPISIKVRPVMKVEQNAGMTVRRPIIGVGTDKPVIRRGVLVSLRASGKEAWSAGVMMLQFLKKLLVGEIAAKEALGGPITIVRAGGEAYSGGRGLGMLFFAALLSLNLGILNLLPIPVLDGGHLPFLLVEAVRGKPVSVQARNLISYIGFAILILLTVFAVGLDISRLFH